MTNSKAEIYQKLDAVTRSRIKRLIRTASSGALSYFDGRSGTPAISHTGIATDVDGSIIFPLSSLAGKCAALEANSASSLLISDVARLDPFETTRISLTGNATKLVGEEEAFAKRRYVAKHPGASLYIDFTDFSVWRFEATVGNYVEGFAKAFVVSGDDVRTPFDDWQSWRGMEAGAVEHMNDDHADAIAHYATHHCGETTGDWRITGLDPEGVDMALDGRTIRLTYEKPLEKAEELRPALVMLARR